MSDQCDIQSIGLVRSLNGVWRYDYNSNSKVTKYPESVSNQVNMKLKVTVVPHRCML